MPIGRGAIRTAGLADMADHMPTSTLEAVRKITSADVRAALVLRYPAQSHALMFEVAPRTGGGTRYADAVAVGLWSSHGHRIEGFEVKVSRADWLNELKQPEKSEPVMRYCNHWWLVCPKGVATTDELPDNWGLLELQDNGTLRVKVQAKKLEPVPITIGFFASLVRRGCEADNEVVRLLVEKQAGEQYERIKAELHRGHVRDLSYKQQAATEAVARIEALKERTGIDFANYEYGDDWFKAVEVVAALGSDFGRGSMRALRKFADEIVKTIDKSDLLRDGGSNG